MKKGELRRQDFKANIPLWRVLSRPLVMWKWWKLKRKLYEVLNLLWNAGERGEAEEGVVVQW